MKISLIVFLYSLNVCSANDGITLLKGKLQELSGAQPELRINLLNDLAWEYTYQDLDSASFFAKEALAIAIKNKGKYPQALSNCYGTLGVIYDLEGDNDLALNHYLESLKIKNELEDSSGVANMKNNIGALFFSQEDYAKSLPYFQQALAIEIALKDTHSQVGSLINIGVIKKNQGELDLAKNHFNKALKLSSQIRNKSYLGAIYNNIGATHLEEKSIDSALHYFEKGETENLLNEHLYNYGIALENQAKIYLLKEHVDLAKSKANKALKLAEDNAYYFIRTNSYETLYEIHLAANNIDSAFYYKGLFNAHRDSILKKENKQIVDEIEAKYELLKKEKAIYRKDIEISKEKREALKFKLIMLGAILASILLIVIIYLKVRSNRALSDKNNIIKASLSEKEILMREIHHRVKNNIQAIKSIINIQRRQTVSDETKESLNETLNRVNAMALIHRKLYQQNSLYKIGSDLYFQELMKDVFQSLGINDQNSTLEIDLCPHVFETDTLLTLGLVLNELITNACKYGKSENGMLHLHVKSHIEHSVFFLKVEDDGIAKFNTEKGFGSDLIEAMVHKLKGKISYLSSKGHLTTIEVPIYKEDA